MSEDADQKEVVAMGCTNGTITFYDVSTSSISDQLEDGHSSSITALTWSHNAGLFSSEEKKIVEWCLKEKKVKEKWKSKGKVSSLAILPDGERLLSGDKKIRLWDLKTKKEIMTFDGHAAQINCLRCLKMNDQTTYVFSSAHSSSDNYLSVWSLNKVSRFKFETLIN